MRLAFIGGWGHAMLRPMLEPDSGQPVEAVAVAGDGVDDARARQRFADKPHTWFDDAIDMLDTFRPDVVNVGAVYGRSSEFIAAALERDIPVVSDKPVAATWEQYDRLRELTADRPDRVIVTEFAFRCRQSILAARDAVAGGRIGQVVLASGQKSYRFGTRPQWYASRELYGGTILWVASHAIDFIHFVTGLRYTRVYGQSANISRPQYASMEECTVNVLELENGSPAVVHADFNRPPAAPTHGDDRLRVVGSEGVVEVIDDRCVLITHQQPPTDITEKAPKLTFWKQAMAAIQGRSPTATKVSGEAGGAGGAGGIVGIGGGAGLGTRETMEMAAVLLSARDAADNRQLVDVRR